MQRIMRTCLLFSSLVFMFFAGCGTPPTDSGTGNPDVSATEQRKQEAFKNVQTGFATLPHNSPQEDNQLLANLLASDPSITAVEVGQGGVEITLFDGEEVVLFNDVPYDQLMETETADANQKNAVADKSVTLSAPLKANAADTRLVVVNSTSSPTETGLFKPSLDAIAAMGQKLGYTVQSPSFDSYENFKNSFKQMSCMVWFGHSAAMNGKYRFVLPLFPDLTKTHPEIGTTLRRAAEVHFDIGGWHIEFGDTFAATEQFASTYWTFKQGGLLLMNLCESGSGDAKAFRQVCNSVGVEAYFGWSAVTAFKDMAETAPAVMDMVLGTNTRFATYHPNAGSEPSRAWSYQTTLQDLQKINRKSPAYPLPLGGYPITRSFSGPLADTPSNLVYRRTNGSDAGNTDLDSVFVPGIRGLGLAESATSPSTLSIFGSFTNEQEDGKVTMNGNELTITTWGQGAIGCQIPNDGDGASGTVIVECRGRESNPVNLTMWNGLLMYTEDFQVNDPQNVYGQLTRSYSLDVRMRGDVHSYRATPTDKPAPGYLAVGAMKGVSKVSSYSVSGDITDVLLDEKHQQIGTDQKVYTKNTLFENNTAFSVIPGHVDFIIVFRPAQHKAEVLESGLNLSNGEHVADHFNQPPFPNKDTEYNELFQLSLNAVLSLVDPVISLDATSFDTGFISAAPSKDITYVGLNGNSTGSVGYSIQAGPFAATHPPDTNAAR